MDKEKLRKEIAGCVRSYYYHDSTDNYRADRTADEILSLIPQAEELERLGNERDDWKATAEVAIDKELSTVLLEPSPDLVEQEARTPIESHRYNNRRYLTIDCIERLISLIHPSIRKQLIKELADEGMWGQVKVLDLEKGDVEWTMWCLGEKFWEDLLKEAQDDKA